MWIAAFNIIYQVLRWTTKLTFWSAMVFMFITMLNLILSSLAITFQVTVLHDLFAILQIWLPFNLSALLAWFVTASMAYFAYKMARVANSLLDNWFGTK